MAASVNKPVVVRAIVQSASQITPTNATNDLIVDYRVTIQLQEVLAGAPEGSMDGDVLSVRLAAGNSGYFRKGAELVILLDPKHMATQKSLYWRRFTRFACIKTTEMASSDLNISDIRTVKVEDDTCLIYGPQ